MTARSKHEANGQKREPVFGFIIMEETGRQNIIKKRAPMLYSVRSVSSVRVSNPSILAMLLKDKSYGVGRT